MEFEIKLEYTVEDFADLWYGFVRKKAGKPLSRSDDPPKWARALGRFFAWFFIVMGVVSIVNSLVQGRSMYVEEMGLLFSLLLMTPLGGLVEIAFGVLALRALRLAPASYLLRPPYARWVRKRWKRWQETRRDGTCVFTGKDFRCHDSRSDYRCDYTELDKLWEDEGHFYLVLNNRAIYILPKAKFVTGDPADLPALWHERTGKRVLPVTPERT